MKRYLLIPLLVAYTLASTGHISLARPGVPQAQDRPVYLFYCFYGLGSNDGDLEPVIRLSGAAFNYSYEQTSCMFCKKNNKVQKISSGSFRQSSVDSIVSLVQSLKDTLIAKVNPCVMSGGIHFLSIAVGRDTTRFELSNTFDYTALKIMSIINQYLPPNKRLWPDEKLIMAEEDCWKFLDEEDNKKAKPATTKARRK